jgi:hypothetical protein
MGRHWKMAGDIWDGAINGAVKGAIFGAIAGGLLWIVLQVDKRLKK